MLISKKCLAIISICAFSTALFGKVFAQSGSSFTIESFKTNFCFDVANNQVSNGTPIQIVPCKGFGHPAQTWIRGEKMPNYECAEGEGNCLYQYRLAANPNFCLDYEYSTKPPAEGAGLQLWRCKDSVNGDAAYWGSTFGYQASAYKLYAGVPSFGIASGKYASISVNPSEGERVRLRTEDENNFYRFWK